jgi:DNA replication protein DnaC
MADAYRTQMQDVETAGLSFEERFGLLVDQHWTWRENQAITRRLKKSKLDAEPCLEDIDFRHPRGLDRPLMRTLITSQWVAQHLAALFTGPTGIGKSWLAQALAQKACRDGYTVLYLTNSTRPQCMTASLIAFPVLGLRCHRPHG